MTKAVYYVSFALALCSAAVSLFVFISIKSTRTDNKQAVILNRFVFFMSLVDFLNALLLSFLLFPYFIASTPDVIKDYMDESDSPVYIATPLFSSGWGGWLRFLYILQSFFWFSSFCFWFMIAVTLFLVLQTHSNQMVEDLYVHIYCWGLPTIFAFCMFEATSKRTFRHIPDEDDWVVVELEHRAIMVVVIYICLSYLIFGVFLMFKTFCEYGVSPIRQRMTLFVGLSLLVWIPAFLEFLSDHLSLMLLSLASMGWVNGIVWISSSRFEPVARICCCLDSEPRVGDRTYLFTNMRENEVEATGGALKRMRKLSSDTTGEYYATVTNTNAPAVNADKATLQIRRIAGDPILKVEQEDSIAVDPRGESLSIAGESSEPVELFDQSIDERPEEITPVKVKPTSTEPFSDAMKYEAFSTGEYSPINKQSSTLHALLDKSENV